jgi:NAD dependent epimerase/dehydratase family enzyme
VRFLIEHEDAAGALQPGRSAPADQQRFTKAWPRSCTGPAVLWVPQTPMRLALGGLAGELLGSLRMRPARLVTAGFEHRDRDLNAVLDSALAT